MLPSLRAKRTPREGAGPLPALLLDRSYAQVVEAKRRNAPGLATLATSVPLYLDQGGSSNIHYFVRRCRACANKNAIRPLVGIGRRPVCDRRREKTRARSGVAPGRRTLANAPRFLVYRYSTK